MPAPAPPSGSVAVCLLSWGRPAITARFLRSLEHCQHDACYWLQNESTRDRSAFDRIERTVGRHALVFHSARNVGFAAGMNRLMDQAVNDGHQWLALCNNDVELGHDALTRIVAQTPSGAAVSGCITSSGGQQAWRHVARRHRGEILPRRRDEEILAYDRRLEARSAQRWVLLRARAVAFSVALIPTSALLAVGPLDESLGLAYGEDNDWCHRARLAGFSVGYTTEVAVRHDHGSSTTPLENRQLRSAGTAALQRKWGSLV